MPIYDLKCIRCEHEFEFMKIRSDEIVKCPKCDAEGKDLVQKPPTNTSFQLKGKGWYKDGY